MSQPPFVEEIKIWLKTLQDTVCDELAAIDKEAGFTADIWQRPAGGGGDTRILSNGKVFEKAGVNFAHIHGATLPAAASKAHPELTGGSFEALGISIVTHPVNPYVPISHCNIRFFLTTQSNTAPVWWFGGGYDLTPCYPFIEDVVAWHQAARSACESFGEDVYPRYKKWCDEYFFLEHRNETRGVGGLFFDDLQQWGFQKCFAFAKNIGHSFMPAYTAIVNKRRDTPFGEHEKQFQLYRRGRYVEFNLVYDRGTLFGLQSSGRTESILMSLPPAAIWRYNWQPESGSAEEDLYLHYLKPQNWLKQT